MPRRVDHEQRRRAVVAAMLRVIQRSGLHEVTMRAVAEEAGISLRLVQYYFETKAGLLAAALHHLETQSHLRWEQTTGDANRTSRDRLGAFVETALPTTPESALFHLAWTSYALMSVTDPTVDQEPFAASHRRLEDSLADELAQATARGETRPRIDARHEAARLLAVLHGTGTALLIGQTTAEDASALLQRHLDGLFVT